MRKIKRSIGNALRNLLYFKHRIMGVEIGARCFISFGAWLDDRRGKIIIGNDVTITRGVKILSHDATAGRLKKNSVEPIKNTTRLDDNVFIGMNVVVLAGVHIHENSIIGAGAVVSKDVPPGCVVVGNPMRIIKKYDVTSGEWQSVNSSTLQKISKNA